MTKTWKCDNCKFFNETEDTDGECRRYPPVPMPNDYGKRNRTQFPLVLKQHWCGEYEYKDTVTVRDHD